MIAFYDMNLVLIQATFTGLLLALSVQVPLRMGVFSFAGAGCFAIGAYTAGILVIQREAGAFVAISGAVLLATVICFVLGLVIHKLNGLYLAMATVAFDLIISVIVINGGELTGASTGLFGIITDLSTGVLIALALVALALVILSELGRTGRRVSAVRDDPELAASMGINVRRYRLVSFAVSGALGGMAGALTVLTRTAIGPLDIGFGLIVLALTMIIVGGSRSWKGAVIGALIFTWLPDVLSVIGEWQELVYGIIVAIAAVFLPRGIHGLFVDFNRWRKRKQREDQDKPDQDDTGTVADTESAAIRGLSIEEEVTS